MRLFSRDKISLITILIVTVFLTACFGGSAHIPDDHYYRLPELKGEKLASPILSGTLSVKKVITHGIYGERTLIYTDKNNNIKLNRYHYHHWEKSPSSLIQDNLVQYLKTIGIAHHVISYSQNTNPDYLLEAELITLHREITSTGSIAVISIDIRLYNKSNNSIYINKRYHSNLTAKSNKLVDTIKAYSEGLHNIYDELISDLQNENFRSVN
ncbi:MAG: ABC-type transport auxiliary lipoprotein family protein [Gammaproteobacteria bacterium]